MYDDLVATLKSTDIPFAEYAWDSPPDTDYGVISVDSEGASFGANMHKTHQAPQGTIDLFTRSNDRTAMQTIQEVLEAFNGCAWYLSSVQYEDATRLIHWEWVFTLEMW